jgi:hypothetical protein
VKVYYKPGDPEAIELDNPPAKSAVLIGVGVMIIVSGLFAFFVIGVALGS